MQRHFFFGPNPPWARGKGHKVKYHLISITKSISKIFIPNFVCILTNERYKTYQTGFSFCLPRGGQTFRPEPVVTSKKYADSLQYFYNTHCIPYSTNLKSLNDILFFFSYISMKRFLIRNRYMYLIGYNHMVHIFLCSARHHCQFDMPHDYVGFFFDPLCTPGPQSPTPGA